MSFSHDKARKINKYNGSELYDKYLVDEENEKRHSLTEMYKYSSCYYLCLTPNYKKVKRFTCDNCYYKDRRDSGKACSSLFRLDSGQIPNMGCIRGRPRDDYYDISGRLFCEIYKIKEGEYWIRYNKEAHKLWQNVNVSSDRYNCGPFLGHTGGR